jgi:protein-tyrosine phosphatase
VTLVNFRRPYARSCARCGSQALETNLFRGGDPSFLTAADAERLRSEHGVARTLDLRSDDEVARTGPPQALLDAGIEWVRCPLSDYVSATELRALSNPDAYSDSYVALLDNCVAGLVDAFGALAAATGLLITCRAGKDRTGVVMALLGATLGRCDECCADEFALSGEGLAPALDLFRESWEKRGLSRDEYALRVSAPRETMLSFLAKSRSRFGGLTEYLRNNIESHVLAKVRARCAERAPI